MQIYRHGLLILVRTEADASGAPAVAGLERRLLGREVPVPLLIDVRTRTLTFFPCVFLT